MKSELDHSKPEGDEESPKKKSQEILHAETEEALEALERSGGRLFLSGLSAGLDIGFSLWLIAIVKTSAEGVLSPPIVEMLLATMYSFGFIIVVLGRSELFTEQTTLAVMPLLMGQTTLGKVSRLWALVYVSNILGVFVSSFIAVKAGPALDVINRQVFNQIADHIVERPSAIIFLSGILAGWLMGLLSWLVAAGRDTISQIVIVWMITAGISMAHLNHSIMGTAEVLAGMFAGSEIPLTEFFRFLLWVTLGNAVGGAFFVAVIKYGHARPSRRSQRAEWMGR